MPELLWIGCGGFLGAVLRYAISSWIHQLTAVAFPVGTFAVNAVGCFFIGVLMAFSDGGRVSPELQRFLGAGLLGALTTFSTFSWDTLELIRSGAPGLALVNVAANVLVGLAAVIAGFFLVRSAL